MSLNNKNINYNDFKNICRTCMFNCDVKFTQDNIISDVFHKLTDIQFETNDELPQQICQKCFEKINQFHEFAFQCKQSHFFLIKCLNNYKKIRFNENCKESRIAEEISIEEHKVEFVQNDESHSTNKFKLKEEFINDDLLISNTSINVENVEESNNNVNLNENSSNSSNNKSINFIESQMKCFKCGVCEKSFNLSQNLKRHMRMHSSERPYKCDACLKTFTLSNHLKEHVRTHSGERPYKCQQCTKSFIQWNHLKRHVKMHSDERPFKCEHCSKSFTQFNSLKIHIISHNNERPYKCDRCNKSFFVSNHLKEHMRTHSGERPYKCAQCEKSFIQSNHLKRHMRTHIN